MNPDNLACHPVFKALERCNIPSAIPCAASAGGSTWNPAACSGAPVGEMTIELGESCCIRRNVAVHDVEFAPSIEYILQETLPALDSLKRAGKARYIGITGYPLSTLREIVERSPVRIDTVLSYCRGTLFDDTLRDYVPFFLGRGMGVANAAVLGMGLLARGPLPAWHPASDDLVAACRSARAHCQEAGVSVEKLGLWYSTNHFDGVHTTIVGMTNTDEVKQNLNAGTINSKERKVLDDLRRRYFLPLQVRHWEGRELQKVRSKLGKK